MKVFTQRDMELADAFNATVDDFMNTHEIKIELLSDMFMGFLAGLALRSGNSRETFAAWALKAYDSVEAAAEQTGRA